MSTQPLMKFYGKNDDVPTDATLMRYALYLNPMFVSVKGKAYQLQNIHFYDNGEVKYSVGRGWFTLKDRSNNDYEAITLADQVQLRRKFNFDGQPFIVTKHDPYGKKGSYAELYLPLAYLESIGYKEETEEKCYRYSKRISNVLTTPYFSITLSSGEVHSFDEWKNDLIKSISECKDKDQVVNVWEEFRFD